MFPASADVLLQTLIPLKAQLEPVQVRLNRLQSFTFPDDEDDEEQFGSCMNGLIWPAGDL